MRLFIALIVSAAWASAVAQSTAPFVIQLPASVPSEQVLVTYCVYAQDAYCSAIPAEPNRLSYSVPATHQGQLVTSLKAILYAPGSAIQTVTLQAGANAYVFAWRPIPPVSLAGTVAMKDVSYAGEVQLELKYVATWAMQFFGMRDGPVPSFPVGEPVYLKDGNRFEFAVPDFASDPVSAAGFLHILAKEKGTGNLSALLVPAGSKTKIDTLKVASFYPPDLAFTICPANASPIHDRFGFAIRGSEEPCVP